MLVSVRLTVKRIVTAGLAFAVLTPLALPTPALAPSGSQAGRVAPATSGSNAFTARQFPRRPAPPAPRTPQFVPGRLIVKFKPTAGPNARAEIRRQERLEHIRGLGLIRAELVRVSGRSVAAAAAALNRRRDVEYAQPDYLRHTGAEYAAEQYFNYLWGLNNAGQTVGGVTGARDVDVNALEAAAVTKGDPNLVVAVIDDGVDFTHPDLAGRAWVNPGESGSGREANNLDDDGNGYVDDVNGWDFSATTGNGDKTVHDPGDYHGTHVSGTIAGSLNGTGVVGVAPNVKIMALKFISSDGLGSDSGAIAAIEYAKAKGVRISNNSYGGPGYSQALKDAIDASGMLFVAAAGNAGLDNDTHADKSYPASFTSPNILSVASLGSTGYLSGFSNYGAQSVDISAPGQTILSSVPAMPATPTDPATPQGWAFLDGTSMATPDVTGVAALAASVKPSLRPNPVALKQLLLDTGKAAPRTAGRTLTGRLVDARAAVDTVAPTVRGPADALVGNATTGTSTVPVRLSWSASDAGSGVARYHLHQSTNYGAWAPVALPAALSTSLTRYLAPGYAYRFRVAATDRAGNYAWSYGPTFQLGAHQETSTSIAYAGTWTRTAVSSAYGGYLRTARAAGARARLSFTGRAVALVAPKNTASGYAYIYIDGVYVTYINLYSTTSLVRQTVVVKTWATSGTHSLEIRVHGTAGHPNVSVDAFVTVR